MGAVTLFSSPDCEGRSDRFFWDPEDPLEGWYTNDDLYHSSSLYFGVHIESAMIPYGYAVAFFDGDEMTGHNTTLFGAYENPKTQQMAC